MLLFFFILLYIYNLQQEFSTFRQKFFVFFLYYGTIMIFLVEY